jgi:hypothetical protein
MRIEQKLYIKLKSFPKEKRKEIEKLIKKINKLKVDIARRKRFTLFDKRYNPKGVFSENNLKMDDMKISLIELEQELKSTIQKETKV